MPRLGTPPSVRRRAAHGHRRTRGLTMIELSLVLGIVAVLISLAIPMWNGWRDKVRVKQAQDDIIGISVVVEGFLSDNGRLPTSLAEVGRSGLRDPWGNPYQYADLSIPANTGAARKDHSLVPLNTDYDLYSSGPDGASSPPLTAASSRDDIVRANNGRFIGPASQY